MTTSSLVDPSAFVRLATATKRDQWDARIERGLLRVTTITRLKLGCSSRTGADAEPVERLRLDEPTPGPDGP